LLNSWFNDRQIFHKVTEPELFLQVKYNETESFNSEAEGKQAAGIFSAGIGKQYKE